MGYRGGMLAGIIVFFWFLVAGVSIGDEVVQLGGSATGFALAEDEVGAETLVVSVHELRIDAVEIDDRRWAVPRVPGGHNLMERGHPSLPYLATEYLLDASGGIVLQLVDVRFREIDLTEGGFAGVAPSKGHFNRTVDPDSVPWLFDDEVYGGEKVYPQADSWVDQPFIAGPLRGQAVRVPVVSWQPRTNILRVVEEASFRMIAVNNARNPRTGPQPAMTGLFDQLARQRAVNHEARYVPFVEAGRLLILADDDFMDEIQPLVDWEVQVGYPTVLTPTSAVGSTATDVMAYIQSLYDAAEGLTWIILVGDYQQIPNFTGVNPDNAPCDACYTKLEGSDNRPDAAISRISAQIGADVTTQVDKILEYERYPDTGSASTWYSAAFGIGSDDEGGTGLADWERIDLLRDDLLDPAYTYTEFDQIYHDSAAASQVTTSLLAGKSLGVYIGHGWSGGWVTTGFDSGNVNSLTNGEMLPVIWSVACNNGQFHDIDECFGEAWLRRAGGGAVSFEGGTTSESWVPPCNAQRGIIDSLRLETAFTTGGQLVNGKLYCMDTDGDGDSAEGTKFMEQSTLFGSCVMWPRTVEPALADEPDDFQSAGGQATLTVKVAGQPYAKANGAIVSFYTYSGSAINVVGSGLIDGNGVVDAAVSGDPTHCHIHGFNLVPQEFELEARPDGRVSLDADVYPCDGVVAIRVADSNVPGSSTSTVDSVTIILASDSGSMQVTLTEDGADRSFYSGTATLGTDLPTAHGETLTASYTDADDGQGGFGLLRTDTAVVDCAGPVISGVHAATLEWDGAELVFTTSEPAAGTLRYGASCASLTETVVGAEATAHTFRVSGLQPLTQYFYDVAATDAAGNSTADNNGGICYSFSTLEEPVYFTEIFEAGDNDLGGLSLTFTPNGSGSFYGACASAITELPVDPAGGVPLSLSDDDSEQVNLAGSSVKFYGTYFSSFWVGSNGYITFDQSDTGYSESLDEHFSQIRLSMLFDDLNPNSGGTVSWLELADRTVVTWDGVHEYSSGASNTFQAELHGDGTIVMSYLEVSVSDGLAGLSQGEGLDADFEETDLSALGDCNGSFFTDSFETGDCRMWDMVVGLQ